MSYMEDDNRMRRKKHDDGEELPELYSIVQGDVASIQSYGAFIKIQGFRKNGLVHKSQISRTRRVEDVSEILAVGDKVYCKVISVGEEDEKKISLSMKVINQDDGSDLDPNLVQTKQEEMRKKKGTYIPKPKIELGAVLNTVCRKCGTKGHLTQDCFHQPGEKTYDLIPDFDVSQMPQKSVANEEKASKGHKKKKKKKEKKAATSKRKKEVSASSDSEDDKYTKRWKKKEHSKKKKRKKKSSSESSSSDSDDSEPVRRHKSEKRSQKYRKFDASSDEDSARRNLQEPHQSKNHNHDDDTRKRKSSKRESQRTRSESSSSSEDRSRKQTKKHRRRSSQPGSDTESDDGLRRQRSNDRTDRGHHKNDNRPRPSHREQGRVRSRESDDERTGTLKDVEDISRHGNRHRGQDEEKRRERNDDRGDRYSVSRNEGRVKGRGPDDGYRERHHDRDTGAERGYYREGDGVTGRSRDHKHSSRH